MRECPECGGPVEGRFHYCPWCSAPQRRKLVEFFRGVDDDEGRALRVSRYLPERRVRFSVWNETGVAEAAVSVAEDEAQRLVGFIAPHRAAPPGRSRVFESILRRVSSPKVRSTFGEE